MYGFQNLILVFLLQYFFLQVCAKIVEKLGSAT